MDLRIIKILRKVAGEPFTPHAEHVLDVLGLKETGYNPYRGDDNNLDKYYIRTRVRGTWGDPDIPRSKWQSSTAWNPWQIVRDRSADIAKYDKDYSKYHSNILAPMYAEMLRTGLSKRDYAIYKATGRLPKNFKGKYNPAADYGGMPRKMSTAEHGIIRNGMLAYINKKMIPEAMKIAKGDENKFWRSIASQHYLGHPQPLNVAEEQKLEEYFKAMQPGIESMRTDRFNWKQRRLDELNRQIEAITNHPRFNEPIFQNGLKIRKQYRSKLENSKY